MQDIPKIYTALAEWLSCVFILIEYRKYIDKKTYFSAGLKLVISFMALCVIQYLCGKVSNILWLAGMVVAIVVMTITIEGCLAAGWKTSWNLCARAFLKAEFLAAIEWQIYYYYFNKGNSFSVILGGCFCFVFYLIGFGMLSWIEHYFFESSVAGERINVTTKNIVLVWSVSIIVFSLSNLSYISVATPFTGIRTMEIFNIRTLFDLAGLLMIEAFHLQKLDADRKQEMDMINMILQKQYLQYRVSQENIDLINRKYHDLKHQIQIIRSEADTAKRIAYLDEIEQGIKRYEMENKTGNSVLDTILTSKSEICLKQGISMTVVANGKLLDHIHVMDLCTIMGNALDNAIEYELQVENPDERLIHVTVHEKNSFVCIVIENYYIGELVFQEGLPITTKRNTEYHGYGLKSIRYSVEKYDGYINIGVKDKWFRLQMLLPLRKYEK